MVKSDFFEREIQKLQSVDLQDFARFFFNEKVGDWFWKSGASSTGKYHPRFSQGEGGLVKHTRAVVWFCDELLRLSSYAYMREEYKDYAILACLLHDTCKYGNSNEENKDCYKNHGALAAKAVAEAWEEFWGGVRCPELLMMAIRSHMGQWTDTREDRPFTNIDRLVHLADYIASRNFLEIPELESQYYEDKARWYSEDTTCFDNLSF